MGPSDHPEISDEALVEQAREGRVRALDVLLDRHQGKVLRVLAYLGVPGQDREDVAQDVFIRVFRHLRSFRRGQAFGGWLYRITVNAAHDHRARTERTARGEAGWTAVADEAEPGPGPAEQARSRELIGTLRSALARLTERERAVFVLREIEGLETRDVARALGITAITVRRHLGRARRRLQRTLEQAGAKEKAIAIERVAPGGSSHS